jgi:hypothetical protein
MGKKTNKNKKKIIRLALIRGENHPPTLNDDENNILELQGF